MRKVTGTGPQTLELLAVAKLVFINFYIANTNILLYLVVAHTLASLSRAQPERPARAKLRERWSSLATLYCGQDIQ